MPSYEEINELITRFIEGEASDQDVATLQNWLQKSADNRKYFDEVNLAFQASVTLNRFGQQKIDKGWGELQSRIQAENETLDNPLLTTNKERKLLFWRVAASVSIFCVVSYILLTFFRSSSQEKQNITISSTKRSNTHIVLPDSSDVWLNANSTLEYPDKFGEQSRIVILKGEAFFDVKKNQRKPFIVQTENMNVLVKGTRFNVEAYYNGQTAKTTLEEGKVELYIKQEDKTYTMKPGDQITLNTRINKVTKSKVDPSDFSAWKENVLVFDNASLEDIMTKLTNRYRVKISSDKYLAKREHFTLTVEQESLEEVLNLIQLSSQLKVRKESDQIILYE